MGWLQGFHTAVPNQGVVSAAAALAVSGLLVVGLEHQAPASFLRVRMQQAVQKSMSSSAMLIRLGTRPAFQTILPNFGGSGTPSTGRRGCCCQRPRRAPRGRRATACRGTRSCRGTWSKTSAAKGCRRWRSLWSWKRREKRPSFQKTTKENCADG